MTEITYSGTSLDASSIQRGNHTGLRLISSTSSGLTVNALGFELQSVPCLVLESALAIKNFVNERELVALFKSLRMEERIEFSHSLHRDARGNSIAGQPYRLCIRVAAVVVHIYCYWAHQSC